MKRLIVLMVVTGLISCGGESNNNNIEASKTATPLAQSKNGPAFNESFGQLLETYYHLKDALVLANDTMATTYATKLAGLADNLQLTEVKSDTSIIEMAKGYVQSVSAEAKGLVGEKDIETKRKSFQMISDNMYDLIRTVRYDREKVYHQFCPMAFNDAGAYWLSKTGDIKNPYFGKKMLTCGEVKDSLDFTGQ
jgi:Cu(I)/Ag(I) efflux system membrane fusion protein